VLLGFTVAAVSPAVVVPSLLGLQERGYGIRTGIPTLVVAAAALDDVFSIAGFGVCLGFALPAAAEGGLLGGAVTGPLADALRVPVELGLGLLGGWAGGTALARLHPFPADAISAVAHDAAARLRLLLLFSMAVAFGLKALGLSGASALATLTLAARVAQQWGAHQGKEGSTKEADRLADGGVSVGAGPATVAALSTGLSQLWTHLAQPLLFGLLGAAVDLTSLSGAVVGTGLAMLAVSVSVRMGVTALAVSGRGLRCEDLLFCAMAWLPKATVQAAVGAVALDYARTEREVRNM
jgi:hypothetical protein